MAEARVMEKGYSLKSRTVASRVEACLRAIGLRGRTTRFGTGRLIESKEMLWKADWHFGRSLNAKRIVVFRIA